MSDWKKAYERGFKIDTNSPSKVVIEAFTIKNNPLWVLDLGCGNGRNSVYAAKHSLGVDAVDIVDLNFLDKLSEELKKKINFRKISVLDFKYEESRYDVVLVTRLIQYLDDNALGELFDKISLAIKPGGVLALNYSEKSKVITQNYGAKKYSHLIDKIKLLIQKHGFKIISIERGNNFSTHVPYNDKIITYDIISQKI